ncbi:MAG: 30S ribosomal protein S5 [Candidatus Aenigmarchaeota archaeon]|nr:30S ribosomal protein S5 [Candidatus Aenigmarchaeota archaeon]
MQKRWKRGRRDDRRRDEEARPWYPRTKLGKQVQKGEITSLAEVLTRGEVILEPEIVDALVPELKEEIIQIGGSPGKGGGVRRTPTKRTARMHKSGRRYKMSAMVVVGDGKGLLGLGKAASRENRTAISKATLQAKLNMMMIRKGCGSWECACGGAHSIPFKATASCGSVSVSLIPGPKGLGVVANETCRRVLGLAGIQDVWVQTFGQTSTRANLITALFGALSRLNHTKGGL